MEKQSNEALDNLSNSHAEQILHTKTELSNQFQIEKTELHDSLMSKCD